MRTNTTTDSLSLVDEENFVDEDIEGMGHSNSPSTPHSAQHDELHGPPTTTMQSFVHLLKGYVGPGCLSLPWAISQLGIPIGVFCVSALCFWSSYNCWIVVRLKRRMIHQISTHEEQFSYGDSGSNDSNINNDLEDDSIPDEPNLDNESTARHRRPLASSRTASLKHLTYPDIVSWLCGRRLHQLTRVSICVQQLAVCTVFFSFIGTNLQAVLETYVQLSHLQIMACALPPILMLSSLPNLKALAPVTAFATILFLLGLALLSRVIWEEWPHRPQEQHIHFQWAQAPLAICAILYSFEGICLVVPVESAMKHAKAYFGATFSTAMTCAAILFSLVAGLSVATFGSVSSGSITAFLLEKYREEGNDHLLTLILWSNAFVSLSVLVTYPLQLFPAVELLEPLILRSFNLGPRGHSSHSQLEVVPMTNASSDHEHTALPINATTLNTSANVAYSGDIPHNGSTPSQEQSSTRRSQGVSHFLHSSHAWLVVRFALVLLTFFVAVAVPNVQSLISLAGALAGASTGLLIPPWMELTWIWKQEERGLSIPVSATYKYTCYLNFLGGFLVLCIGTGSSIVDIVQAYV